jgi:hypothetical protein
MFKTYETNMVKMGEKILEKARWDGGWPCAVCVGMGNVVLVNHQKHYDQVVSQVDKFIKLGLFVVILFVIFIGFLIVAVHVGVIQ